MFFVHRNVTAGRAVFCRVVAAGWSVTAQVPLIGDVPGRSALSRVAITLESLRAFTERYFQDGCAS